MGFKKTIQYRGLTISDAYHRIDTTGSANGLSNASLNIYTTREAYKDGEGYLDQMMISYPISYGIGAGADKNQGYDYLLTLPENADVISVFEDDQPN